MGNPCKEFYKLIDDMVNPEGLPVREFTELSFLEFLNSGEWKIEQTIHHGNLPLHSLRRKGCTWITGTREGISITASEEFKYREGIKGSLRIPQDKKRFDASCLKGAVVYWSEIPGIRYPLEALETGHYGDLPLWLRQGDYSSFNL